MRWEDKLEIIRALEENYADEELEHISLVDLHEMIITLPDFADDPEEASSDILQDIYDSWLDMK